MITMCTKCGNPDWDKIVSEDKKTITCPRCGAVYHSTGQPLFILTGCSGVGKTSTAQELMQRNCGLVVLDADYFQFMPSKTNEDWASHVERQEEISADIMQCGKPVLWSMAGCLDRLPNTYNERFFPRIYCLALTCEPEELRRRMTEGRKISAEEWLCSSRDYNQYFLEHNKIGEQEFDQIDTTNKSVEKVADEVLQWVKQKLHTKQVDKSMSMDRQYTRIDIVRGIVDGMLEAQTNENRKRNGYVHLYGVGQAGAMLALCRGYDRAYAELAEIAGMLHDFVKYRDGIEEEHAVLSSEAVRPLLTETQAFTEEEVELICQAIAVHSQKTEKHNAFAELLKDADDLQHSLRNPVEEYFFEKPRVQAVFHEVIRPEKE